MSNTSPEGSSDCPEQKNGTPSLATPSPSRSISGTGTRSSAPVRGCQSQTSVTLSRVPSPFSGARPQNITSPVATTTALRAQVGKGIVCGSQRPTSSAAGSAAAIRVASAAACRDARRSICARSAAGSAIQRCSASRCVACS